MTGVGERHIPVSIRGVIFSPAMTIGSVMTVISRLETAIRAPEMVAGELATAPGCTLMPVTYRKRMPGNKESMLAANMAGVTAMIVSADF